MNNHFHLLPVRTLRIGLLLIVSAASASGFAAEPTSRDEARWQREDTTPAARRQTLVKEANAAYRENLNQCKVMPAGERAACTKEARETLQRELREAKGSAVK